MKRIIICLLLVFPGILAISQHEDSKYIPEDDPLVIEKLDEWQDLKFGLLMHWGPYSQWGIVESWSLCPEEYGWCERKKGSAPMDYFTYKKEYENLKLTFNPVDFNPDQWAEAAKKAGMRYMVFTTKHHDGFSMFDTKLTDYKVRVLDSEMATAAKVRVLIESTDGRSEWTTIGVSTDIIEASWLALVDSIEYCLSQEG